MHKPPKKIAIVGPESTGKSTLTSQLAAHYHTVWVPEYARTYCEGLTQPCTLEDELNMFYGQIDLEKSIIASSGKGLIFCDTTFLTVKIWSDEMFGSTPKPVLNAIPAYNYDLYLLLDIDLPWEDDPLRDFPNQREYFMEIWHKELKSLKANYQVISGTGDQRFNKAVLVIDAFLKNPA